MAGVSLSALTSAVSGASSILLVSPQATIGYQPTPGATQSFASQQALPPSFLFHYEGENKSTLHSDITDHYVEDNTSIQDQIALPPVKVSTQGFIGELNNVIPLPQGLAGQIVGTAVSKLSPLAQYAPGLSVSAQIAYNEAFFAYQIAASAANTVVSGISTINGTGGESVVGPNGLLMQPNQGKQQTAYQMFYGYWLTRTLFTVQTPWAVFQNMAIEDLSVTQTAETTMISDFEITFKQLRFANSLLPTTTLYQDNVNFGSRLQQQGAGVTNLGTSALSTSPQSFTTSLSNIG